MKSGIYLITEERDRQIHQKGWSPEHDAMHSNRELVEAAICYAQVSQFIGAGIDIKKIEDTPECWPWDAEWWKPSADPVRNLVKAGALIAAEIDRLRR